MAVDNSQSFKYKAALVGRTENAGSINGGTDSSVKKTQNSSIKVFE